MKNNNVLIGLLGISAAVMAALLATRPNPGNAQIFAQGNVYSVLADGTQLVISDSNLILLYRPNNARNFDMNAVGAQDLTAHLPANR